MFVYPSLPLPPPPKKPHYVETLPRNMMISGDGISGKYSGLD